MKILVSNDDGFRAEGIRRLREALATLDGVSVTVMAPDRNRSGASNSLTLDVPLRVFEAEPGVYYVPGTPTDCVHLAMSGFFDYEHDMVVSGVNDGPNLGDDVLYSGTVAAAIEGRFLGLPTLAVSLCTSPGSGRHFQTGAAVARLLVGQLLRKPLERDRAASDPVASDRAVGDPVASDRAVGEGIPSGRTGIPSGGTGIPSGGTGILSGGTGIPRGGKGIPSGDYRGLILNVNVPDLPLDKLRGFRSSRLGYRHRSEPIIPARDPRGRPVYWVGPAGAEQDAGPGTDFDTITQGYVSVTPLQIDLTRHAALPAVQSWLEGING